MQTGSVPWERRMDRHATLLEMLGRGQVNDIQPQLIEAK
jgi:hypothetical protein